MIAGRYGLAISSFESIAGGAENSSYLLGTDQGRMVLTLFESKTMEEAQRLGTLLSYLEEVNFPSTLVLPLPKGGLVSSHQGKAVMLKHYLDGQVHTKLSEDMLRQLGGKLAQLHGLSSPAYLPDVPAFGLKRIRAGLDEVRDADFRAWLIEWGDWLEQQLSWELPRGLVHADLFQDNVLFADERLLALIDFEDAGHYKLVYDIGMAIVGTCLVELEIAWPAARALLAGYEEVRRLEEGERRAIQASVVYGAMSTAYWRYWKYNIYQPTPERTDKYLEMKAVADKVRTIAKDSFIEKISE